jgi:hypothetical protein
MERAEQLLQHACGGAWEPMPGWVGRYRCNRCGVIGYRRGINDMAYSRADESGNQRTLEYIVAYCCKTKGCGQPAVAKDKGKWRCGEHRAEGM